MSIYHLSVKPICRATGRSAPGAAAYRCAALLIDERTGQRFDYRRKPGVVYTEIVLPSDAPEWASDHQKLWSAAEAAERRKDACVAREYEVSLPHEITDAQRLELVQKYVYEMVESEGCAVNFAIHAPSKKEQDNKNWHVHILRTTRVMTSEGLGQKLETEKSGRKKKRT